VSDTFYPGWRVYVDSHSQPIVEVFGALRGIVIDEGSHSIEMRYEPLSVFIGALLSLAGVIACVVLAWVSRRRVNQQLGCSAMYAK
jgi:uncharacterized membrane protein YfhO